MNEPVVGHAAAVGLWFLGETNSKEENYGQNQLTQGNEPP